MSEKERVIDHLDIVLRSRYSGWIKPKESDYKEALAFMERHIPPELGWEIDGQIIYEETADEKK